VPYSSGPKKSVSRDGSSGRKRTADPWHDTHRSLLPARRGAS
jgi:hypothetical protein